MKTTVCLLTAALMLSVSARSAAAQEGGKKRAGHANRLVAPQVQKAVPGINALFTLKGKNRKKLAALHKEILGSETVLAAQKTVHDRNASKEDRKAAREVVSRAQASYREKLAGLLDKDTAALLVKVNATAKDVQASLREEFRPRLRDSRGNKEERQKVQKEMAEKSQNLIAARVKELLTDEQKAALKTAANPGKKQGGEEGKKKAERKKKQGKEGAAERKKKREERRKKQQEEKKKGGDSES